MSAMGKEGIKKAALLSMSKAHYLKDVLLATGLFELVYQGEFFNEFVTRTKIWMTGRCLIFFLKRVFLADIHMKATSYGVQPR